ncbi:MAG TPA: LPS assembly protein LptD [Rudaea sp.]|nr:LPS assembly protein LptD [Rudaea sp.]
MPNLYRSGMYCQRLLVSALSLVAAQIACADTTETTTTTATATICPVGVLICPKHKVTFEACKKNDMLDFYEPGLPTTGDRSTSPTDVSSQIVNSTDATHYRLEGDVRLQRLDQLLRSDFLTFDTETTDYTADGNVRMQDDALLLSGDHAKGTVTPSTTYVTNARYQLLQERGNGTAATVNETDPDHTKLTDATYSTCDVDAPQWHIHGNAMEMDHVEQRGYGHGMTMYYGNTPFFWFPYLSISLNNQRETGFLTPSFDVSTRKGLEIGAPYYLNLAPNYDATITPVLSTERGAILDGQFRYIDATDRLQIDASYTPHDANVPDELSQISAEQAAGSAPLQSPLEIPFQRYQIHIQDSNYFNQNWSAAVDINRVSDKQYFQDYGDTLTTSATSLLGSSAYVNGRGEWWTASIGGDSTQITQPYLSEAFLPYERLPRATFQGEHSVIGDFVAGVNAEYVDFKKGPFDILQPGTDDVFTGVTALEGQRIDVYPYIAYPIETAGYFIRPELGLRYTSYDLRNVEGYDLTNPAGPQFTDRTPNRSVPIFSVDAGLVFDRDADLFGKAFTQTLEPRIYYLRVPYRNQADLPIFDTQLPTFDFPSLFRNNAFVGADRQSNANNLTLALTSRLIDTSSGDQLLSASIGQIHYFDPQRVQLPFVPEVDFSGSDYVAEVDLRLNDRWDIKWDQQYNPNSKVIDPQTAMLIDNMHHTDLSSISLEHRFAGDGIFNISYRYRRGLLEQVDAAALYPLNNRWSLIGRYYYSLLDRQLLEAFAGTEYDSCCVAMRVLVRRYINAIGQIKPNTGLYFEVEFKGLAATGQRTESFLRRAILGYE